MTTTANWKETHEIRINAARKAAEAAVANLNKELLNLPPKFRLTVNDDGRDLKLVEAAE